MKFVNMLLAAKVTPIFVFDGRHLPAKASTEKKRRENREASRKRSAELLREGRIEEARSFLRRCIDVTHEMALALMKECRRVGVDCIVAPYEADAQLAYLNLKGIVQVVITEDSDLVLFGCSHILFKMDLTGNGLLVERERLFMAMRVRPEGFCFDKFRNMCILSGCDYLASLPGIGLSKACKFVTKTAETDIHKALVKLPRYLNMNHLTVTEQYRDDFVRAVETFRYQLVFDPVSRKLVPLTDPPCSYSRDPSAGEMLPSDVAFQLALGNLDPFTLSRVDSFDPDNHHVFSGKRQRPSIWSRDYEPKEPVVCKRDPADVDRPATKRKAVAVKLHLQVKQQERRVDSSVSDVDLTAMYGDGDAADTSHCERVCREAEGETPAVPDQSTSDEPPCKKARHSHEPSPPRSPVLCRRNPFARQREEETSPSLLAKFGTKFGALGKFSQPCGSSASANLVVCSRYFVTEAENASGSKEIADSSKETESGEVSEFAHQHSSADLLKDVGNVVELQSSDSCKAKVKISPCKRSRLQDAEGENNCQAKTNNYGSPVKLNTSSRSDTHATENRSPSRSQKSFKWGDLRTKFGFEANHSLQRSRSTRQAFKNPRKEESSSPLESISQNTALSQGGDNLSESSAASVDSGFLSDSSQSQREKLSEISQHLSKTETRRRPGFKNPVKQQSLLNLFGFQKKQKLVPT